MYERRAGRVANCGRAKADKDRGRKRESGERRGETNEIKGTEIEQRALEEENGMERREGSSKRGMCVRETSNLKFISIRGGACSDSASVALTLFSFLKFWNRRISETALESLSFRLGTFSVIDENSGGTFFQSF